MIILKDGAPFPGTPQLSPEKIRELIKTGLWTKADLDEWGLAAATPFVAPAGKVITGVPRYTESTPWWIEEYDVVDPPPPTAEEIRLAAFGAEADVIDLKNRMDTSTAAQVNTWVDANVTTLAQARSVLKTLIKIVILTRRGL